MTCCAKKPKYTASYFIRKFSKIPDEKWTVGFFEHNGKYCALGHCGARPNGFTNEAEALEDLFRKSTWKFGVEDVNDGAQTRFEQKTPKARILAALQILKEQGL